jgi:hypothetical protein
MNRISIRLILILLPAWIFFARASQACSCVQAPGGGFSSNCADVKIYDNTFVGTVIDIENPPEERWGVDERGLSRYKFHVDENINGVDEKEVDIYSGRGSADCSYHFRLGQTYFVVPGKDPQDGKLRVTICGSTRLAATVAPLIAELRARRDAKPLASIEGELGTKQQPYASTFYAFYSRPLVGVTVELHDDDHVQSTQTNSAGIYRFDDVAPGTYHLSAQLPHNFVMEQNSPSDPLPSIAIADLPCYVKVIHALPTSRIRGRVFDPHGAPLQNADVALFGRGRYKDAETGWWQVQTDKNGYYEFDHVTPGLFLVVFNNTNKSDATSPYPRTFYPSAPDFDTAVPITIGNDDQFQGDEEVLNADIHVLPASNPSPAPKY